MNSAARLTELAAPNQCQVPSSLLTVSGGEEYGTGQTSNLEVVHRDNAGTGKLHTIVLSLDSIWEHTSIILSVKAFSDPHPPLLSGCNIWPYPPPPPALIM